MGLRDEVLGTLARFDPVFDRSPSPDISSAVRSLLGGVRYEEGYNVPDEFQDVILRLYALGGKPVTADVLADALLSIHGLSIESLRQGEDWIGLRKRFASCGKGARPPGTSSMNEDPGSSRYHMEGGDTGTPDWTLSLSLSRGEESSRSGRGPPMPSLEVSFTKRRRFGGGAVDSLPNELLKSGVLSRFSGCELACRAERPHGGETHVSLGPVPANGSEIYERLLKKLEEKESLYNPRALAERTTSIEIDGSKGSAALKFRVDSQGFFTSASTRTFTRESWQSLKNLVSETLTLIEK